MRTRRSATGRETPARFQKSRRLLYGWPETMRVISASLIPLTSRREQRIACAVAGSGPRSRAGLIGGSGPSPREITAAGEAERLERAGSFQEPAGGGTAGSRAAGKRAIGCWAAGQGGGRKARADWPGGGWDGMRFLPSSRRPRR